MGWQFCIDRGGTFTDVIARTPEGETRTHKLLSEQPGRRDDAALHAIRHLMGLAADDALHPHAIESVRIGTTVATNALLERKGERTLLVTTRGFADALRIGYQARPKLFALDIELPSMLYETVLEVDERVGARGEVLRPLDESAAREALQGAFNAGLRSVAIVFMHGYRFTAHEAAVASIAREVGFTEVCPSHEIAPMMKLVSRGDTTVADAYLTPILRRYVEHVRSDLGESADALLFMKSSGGLAPANRFRGKDALLSGPAGGVVGMIGSGRAAGFERLIGFDMGGTSTDVSHYAGELERSYERSLAGVRIVAPMMAVHTVAAGGGSVLHFDGARMRVGPESAGAVPGPAAYGAGGPLTVTDCHVALGRLRPEYFPKVFGEDGRQPLDVAAVHARFDALGDHVAEATGRRPTPEALADGFLAVAVDNMAAAIKKISVQRGYDVTEYTLCAFGGAGGQHACLVADALGIERVLLHPLAGVLSAYGIGQADLREVREQSVEAPLSKQTLRELVPVWAKLEASVRAPGASLFKRVALRYEGSSTALRVPAGDAESLRRAFDVAHRTRFGFTSPEKRLVVDAVHVESVVPGAQGRTLNRPRSRAQAVEHSVYFGGASMNTRFLHRDALEGTVEGPAVLLEETGTTIVEPGWSARRTERGDLLLERTTARERSSVATEVDPVHLEVFNNLFMNIAEQMGVVLEKTAASVNIKERLDFSCALFDRNGELIANAPHMPVHLGSMSESIKSLIRDRPELQAGQVYVMNAPYNGGTHLPDITVIRPVFDEGTILFFVAARGHHADVGGTAAGSA
ncbi:MAG: hydantoinase/oxoprolinase family protein, partial [Myxococcota bacterium]